MRVIFLDIDGVLRTGRCVLGRKQSLYWRIRIAIRRMRGVERPNMFTLKYSRWRALRVKILMKLGFPPRLNPRNIMIDPLGVYALNRLGKRCDAVIVLNSTWSLDGLKYVRKIMKRNGLTTSIIGRTNYPRKFDDVDGGRLLAIQEWIETHNAGHATDRVTHWCTFDDAPIDDEHAILVNQDDGIMLDMYRQASGHLGNYDKFSVLM